MEYRSAILSALFLSAATFAQQDWRLEPMNSARGFIPIDLGSGSTAYAIDRNFGFDSSYVELMWTDAQQNVTNARSHRLFLPLTFLNDFEALDDGYLVAGASIGFSNYPFLFRTDLQGDAVWYQGLINLDHFQDQLLGLFTEGNEFTTYTYPGGTYRDGVYRFDGSVAQGFASGVDITTPSTTKFRVYDGCTTAVSDVHLMCGAGYANDSSQTKNVLLMKVGPAGATWMKWYDMGANGTQIEDVNQVLPLADGNFLAVGAYSVNNVFHGFVMKVDDTGSVIWTRRYEDTAGALLFASAIELPNGDLAVSGTDENYKGMLLRLGAAGDVQWARQYQAGGIPGTHILDRLRPAYPSGYWVQSGSRQLYLDSALAGCDLVDVFTVQDAPWSIVPVAVTFNNVLVLPDTLDFTHSARMPIHSWVSSCIVNGVEEQRSTDVITAYPDPTDGPLFLNGYALRSGAWVVVRDAMGREVLRTRYQGQLDLGGLPSGSYLLEFPELEVRLRVVKQ